MLTQADDFPIHQTPEPIAFSGSDRNFYDRYFFNGYSAPDADDPVFFSVAMGVYPHLDVIDAAFCIVTGGRQINVRASRRLHSERLETHVGPIRIEIPEPLLRHRITVDPVDDAEDGVRVRADLHYTARHAPIQEPRFTRRNGPRMFMDYTRMTQCGSWQGTIEIDGRKITVDGLVGSRDRSWGIRSVGKPDSQPPATGNLPQFYWLWAPLNFDDFVTFAHTNDDAEGNAWNRRAVVQPLGSGGDQPEPIEDTPNFRCSYFPGSRRVERAQIQFGGGASIEIETAPPGRVDRHFYMSGLGYTHPIWGHGFDHGELEVGCDVVELAEVPDNAPEWIHIQALATARLTTRDGTTHEGYGVLEQFLIGPHGPSGFSGALDPAAG